MPTVIHVESSETKTKVIFNGYFKQLASNLLQKDIKGDKSAKKVNKRARGANFS